MSGQKAADMTLPILQLAASIAAAAPQADSLAWAAILAPYLQASGIDQPRRIAALLGQMTAEAGPRLAALAENTRYTKPERLCVIFPKAFPSMAIAARYAGDAIRIANRAYAGRLGNGDETSGDGYRFRGSGLLQLTGRTHFTLFAQDLGVAVEPMADWLRTPPGAAASACWYWKRRKLNLLADAWNLAGITQAVNGHAMLAAALRAAAAEAALRVLNQAGVTPP